MFSISHVGTGSNWLLLRGAELISFWSSSVVTGVQFSKVGTDLDGTSYDGIVMMDARTESTLSLKMRRSHLLYGVTRSTLWSVCHNRCALPCYVVISLRRKVVFFFTYTTPLSCSALLTTRGNSRQMTCVWTVSQLPLHEDELRDSRRQTTASSSCLLSIALSLYGTILVNQSSHHPVVQLDQVVEGQVA